MTIHTIHNVETGEITEVELTAEELAKIEADNVELEAQKAELIAKAEARVLLLERLGITEDEAKLLLG